MKKGFLFSVLVAAVLFNSCMGESVKGSGDVKSENRPASEAKRIKVSGDMDVFILQGPPSIRVEADDNILQYIETAMRDNWLEIKTRDDININTSSDIKVYVTTPEITDLSVSGSGNIKSDQKFSTDDKASFNISGSGDITAAINAPKVETHITGSGDLRISGETKDAEIHISGSGNYDGRDLKAENVDVSIAGSGDADVFAENKLKASVAGSGNVKYKGNATVDTHIAGSGAVTKR
jgi:hypothetical protein